MFKGFNLKLKEQFPSNSYNYGISESKFDKALDVGKEEVAINKKLIGTKLEQFLRNDNKLDGKAIIDEWFPKIEADVFISHSHKNEKQAIALAGWLKETFELNSFIDSLVWGYAPNLIDMFNKNYNIIRKSPSNVTYGYNTAKIISNHVDLMLSTALNTMIDHCETLMFLNIPHSTGEVIKNGKFIEVESPWIYSELETSRIVREKLNRRRNKLLIKSFSNDFDTKTVNESKLPQISYDTDISHLYHLTEKNLIEWERLYKLRRNGNNNFGEKLSLDTLYDLVGIE